MIRFLKRLSLFFIFSLFFVLIIQVLISLKIKEKTLHGIDNLDQTSNVNADLVFLGSSRCWDHFDPCFFNTTFKLKSVNIGVEGHSELQMSIVRLKYYLSRNQAPKYAILSFDPFMEGTVKKNKKNVSNKNIFARYAFFPRQKDILIVDYFGFDNSEKYIPLYALFKYKLLEDCLYKTHITNYEIYGFGRQDKAWDTILSPITDLNKKYYFKNNEVPAITELLMELNHLCVKYKIKLLCIQTPVYKVLYDKWAFSETKNICETLKIPFVDVNKVEIRDDKKCFYNSNHLNYFGVNQMNVFLQSDTTLITFFKDQTD